MVISAIERRLFMQTIVLIVCASISSLAAPAPKKSAEGNPNDVISAIYERTLKEESGEFVWGNAADRPHFLSKGLVALWVKVDAMTLAGDEGPGGFDFVTDTNGLTIGSFKSVLERNDTERAVVAVTIGYKEKDANKGPHVLRYDLTRENGNWKIDNIQTTKWDLRKMLTDYVAGKD